MPQVVFYLVGWSRGWDTAANIILPNKQYILSYTQHFSIFINLTFLNNCSLFIWCLSGEKKLMILNHILKSRIKTILVLDGGLPYHPGWSTVALRQLTEISASWVQVILQP